MALTSQDKVRAVTGGQSTGWGGREPPCEVPEVTENLAVLQDLAIFGPATAFCLPWPELYKGKNCVQNMHVETRDMLNVHHLLLSPV